ncbi:SUZ domain protein [Toxoplasma gondii TgCatPRC2]|uniref:SUZ domain protein n=2 Tax=Toxoplasma gondii TaxID=5811 RepID=A0A151HNK8_TOXGO|nr:SUZ domain protein [Toxoplasma gondii ARI]KYK70946.1 SUZ domain protein [Toxoplasma gondii TgCatPRC2]
MTCLDPSEEPHALAFSHASEESETHVLKAADQHAPRSSPSVVFTSPAGGSPRSAGEGHAETAQDKDRPSVPPLRGVWASRAARQDQAASLSAETKREDADAEAENANQPQAETEGSSTTVAAASLLSPPEACGSPGEPCSQREATETEVPPSFLTPLPSEIEEPGERGQEACRTEEAGKAPTVEADAREAGGSESPHGSPDDERREGRSSEQGEREPSSFQEDQGALSTASRTEKLAYESKLAGVSGPNNEAGEASPASPPPPSPSSPLPYLTSARPSVSGSSKVAVVGAKTLHEQAGKEGDGTKPKKLILLRRGDVAPGPCSFSVSVMKKGDNNDFAPEISTSNGQTDGARNEGTLRRVKQPEDQTENEGTGVTRPPRVEGTGKSLEEREREYNELRARIFSTSQRESPSASPGTNSPIRARLPRKNLTRSYQDHFDPEFMRSVIPPPGAFHLPPGYVPDGRHAGFAWGTSPLPQHRPRVQEAQGLPCLPCEVRDRGLVARSIRSGRRRSYLRSGAAFQGGGDGPARWSADMEVRRTWDLRVDRRGFATGETRAQTEGVETPGSRPESLEEQKPAQ